MMRSLPLNFVAMLLLATFGCTPGTPQGAPVYPSGDPAPRSFATAAHDTLILGRIKAKLFSDDLVDGDGMDITVRHCVVFVTGYAADDYDRRMTVDLIRTVDGVKRVESRLQVRHKGTTFETAETMVAKRIKMALLTDRELNTQPIGVQATSDKVILTGTVSSQTQKQKVTAIAAEHSGSRQVVDRLKLAD